MNEQLENLIVKFLNKSASSEELTALNRLVEQPENLIIFKEYVKVNHNLNYTLNSIDADERLNTLLRVIKTGQKKQRRRLMIQRIRYSSAAIVLLSLGIYYFTNRGAEESGFDSEIINSTIKTGTDKAVLTLSNGSEVPLEKGSRFTANNASSDGEQLVYHQAENHPPEIEFNTLTIPRGGQFSLQLSDSTKVWLNSATKLRYPTTFITGSPREVELVYGEAYFDVSPSSANKGAAFKVVSRDQQIEVLGTAFNLKAYEEEPKTYTTLVHGKVAIRIGEHFNYLNPNQQAVVQDGNILRITQIDVYNETSWKDGVFSFEGKTLDEIMTVLSRWFDMEVQFEDEALKKVKFVGVLGKEQEIVEILETIKSLGNINNYQINNKTITLK